MESRQSKQYYRHYIKKLLSDTSLDILDKASIDICKKATGLFNSCYNKNILTFRPLKFEPDISTLNNFLGIQNNLFYPDLKEILVYDKSGDVVHKPHLDYIIMPARAIDKNGVRLGRGGGWYDRLLKDYADTLKIAVIFDLQLLEQLPCEVHDINIGIIVTEKRIIRLEN